jgi:hypothetical protein
VKLIATFIHTSAGANAKHAGAAAEIRSGRWTRTDELGEGGCLQHVSERDNG